ncbi:hypothetical protein NLU13_7727 [Sarocladium strictum]|uniref:Uncharacterized protein n=1 Tax=Sarocladium strictum TaxID=5046 RepID=A0AA39GDM9_SARSR|nr:hypothetical protein NLU13_7727 [Sarocladium strictum]
MCDMSDYTEHLRDVLLIVEATLDPCLETRSMESSNLPHSQITFFPVDATRLDLLGSYRILALPYMSIFIIFTITFTANQHISLLIQRDGKPHPTKSQDARVLHASSYTCDQPSCLQPNPLRSLPLCCAQPRSIKTNESPINKVTLSDR